MSLTTMNPGAPAHAGAKAPGPTCGEAGGPARPRVIGIDLSLTSTGIATETGVDTIRTQPHGDTINCRSERIREIRSRILDWTAGTDLAVIEGPAFGKNNSGIFDRSWLWGSLTDALLHRGIPVAVVPPANLKKYATGKGNADKEAVLLAAARRFPTVEISNNNEADAQWLLAMGLDHLGAPLIVMPDAQRKTLANCQWPEPVIA